MIVEKSLIIQNKLIVKDTYEMKCKSELASQLEAGQFINIKIDGFYLRRPISICAIDKDSFTIIYKVVGEGTLQLSKYKLGESIDILGPLGHGFPIEKEDHVLILGGGVGVPPLYELAKQFRKTNTKVTVILGFQTKESVFYEEEFRLHGCETYVACDDGSYGYHGNVIALAQELGLGEVSVYSCGPLGMLKAVSHTYKKGYISIESRMACGMGACMACVVKPTDKTSLSKRICKDGPVFAIGEVEL